MKLEISGLRRVLCALDVERTGSPSLAMASLLAERFHASVDALYATSSVAVARQAEQRLSGIVTGMKRHVCVSSFVAPGPASAAILAHSERHSTDLIVMAASSHRRFSGGPKTIAPVSAHAPCAVLTVGGRFQAAPLRRILVPIAAGGVEKHATSWVTALASRFDAEVGLLRIEQPRSGFWDAISGASQLRPTNDTSSTDGESLLAALRHSGIDAYEVAHSGGSDSDALAGLCNAGSFDTMVVGLPAGGEGHDPADVLAAALRQKTNALVLTVRALRSPALFAPGWLATLPKVAGADWVQPEGAP